MPVQDALSCRIAGARLKRSSNMGNPTIHQASRDAAAGGKNFEVSPKGVGDAQHDLSPEQIARWAKLIADGQEPFPTGLRPEQEEQMLRRVRRLRRASLVRFIARQIAGDIAAEIGGRHGGNDA
jgi:hypothetical protein